MSEPASKSKASRLRAALAGNGIVVAPGVYDMISARIADRMGFDALYLTGYGGLLNVRGATL